MKFVKFIVIFTACLYLCACWTGFEMQFSLQSKINVDVIGAGTVTIDDSLYVCDHAADDFCWVTMYRTSVRLTPIANPGYEFAGWNGDCIGLGYCDIYTNKEFHVSNAANPQYAVSATFVPAGSLSLTNTSSSLQTVLENGQLAGSCDRYFDNLANPAVATNYLKLMCGKWMFFYDGFQLLGVPKIMVDMLLKYAPNSMGPGFSNFGLIQDPYSAQGYPLGIAKGKTINNVETMAFGCASCHFGKTGSNYSVGQANHDYEYGKHIMAMTFIPVKAAGPELFNQPISANLDAWLVPQVAELQSNLALFPMLLKMAPLGGLLSGGGSLPIPSVEKQDMYLTWKKGTQDFVIDPVGLDDNVETISKIQPLWGLYTPADMSAHGGPSNAMLGFTGSTPDIDVFIQDFIVLSLGAGAYDDARRKPLRDYLMTLSTPANPSLPLAADITAGQTLFTTKGCSSCHNGPNKSGTRLFTYAEMGVDNALMEWADKYADGSSEVPELFQNGSVLTHELKAPKLVGMWSQKIFLHNGSVDGLESLFCLPPKPLRPTINTQGFSDKGHMMTCVVDATNPSGTLTDADKTKLIAYLKSL